MNESIKALLTKIAGSEELQAKFETLDTPEKAYELAKTLQDGFTKEEFLDAVNEIAEAQVEDISDEELAATAGGVTDDMNCRPTTENISRTRSILTPRQTDKTAVTRPPISTIIRTSIKND